MFLILCKIQYHIIWTQTVLVLSPRKNVYNLSINTIKQKIMFKPMFFMMQNNLNATQSIMGHTGAECEIWILQVSHILHRTSIIPHVRPITDLNFKLRILWKQPSWKAWHSYLYFPNYKMLRHRDQSICKYRNRESGGVRR